MEIKSAAILFLSLSLAGSAACVGKLVKDNAKLEQRLTIAAHTIETQNKAIEQIKLDSEKYHCSIDDMNNYTRDKYSKVIRETEEHESGSCEAKLESLEKALLIFNSK